MSVRGQNAKRGISRPSRRSGASHVAVVPSLAWPTMKKSGTRPRWAGGGLAARSADALIAPERDEITPQVLAESLDLGLEAAAQEGHELLVGRRRRAIHQA